MTQKYSSREEQAFVEAGRTAISAAQKRLLTAVFLAVVFFAPLYQQMAEIRAWFSGSRLRALPQCYDIFGPVFSALKEICRPTGHPIACLFNANSRLLRSMHAYEDSLEDSSLAGQAIRPSIQYVMTRWLGAGNDKTYCGRDNWLFYRPDIDYIIHHGFLNTDVMERRAASGSETINAPHPDPRPAILAFNAELMARGIKLILMPTPVKPVIHPEKFAAGFENKGKPVHNFSYQEFISDMEKALISVFDASEVLVQDKEINKRDQFLAGDTHWRPEAMELCALSLAEFIRQHADIPPTSPAGYIAARTNVVQKGDIVAMLRLPERGKRFGAESVFIRRIFEPDGRGWQPSRDADILMLGDSFANVYSLEAMGWGSNAGFVEQLSYEMQRPIDLLAVNDNAAYSTRELLLREISRRSDRLEGKRAVIWQFAARELTEGDWKIFDLKAPLAQSSFLTLPPGSKLTVKGQIKAIASAPRPGSVPYADHIVAAHLISVMEGANEYGPALVYLFSMTNHVLTKAAGLKAGDSLSLRLRPWSDVSATYERINRAELDDPELLIQEPCWGELIPGEQ